VSYWLWEMKLLLCEADVIGSVCSCVVRRLALLSLPGGAVVERVVFKRGIRGLERSWTDYSSFREIEAGGTFSTFSSTRQH